MAVDDSGEWWTGSEPSDIECYLAEYTSSEECYPATALWPVTCLCESDRFRLSRAGSITRRICTGCGQIRYISREGGSSGWEEATEEEGVEECSCVGCNASDVNVCLGFADYSHHPGFADDPGAPLPDAVLWFYVGVRCTKCGILGCFNDSKVGWGPMGESTFRLIAGDSTNS
jgi:hypothetical protein